MKKDWRKLIDPRRTLTLAASLCIAILFYFVLLKLPSVLSAVRNAFAIISPFLWGAVIAYLIEPLCTFFETRVFGKLRKRRAARSISVVISFILSLGILALLLLAVIPQLIDSIGTLVNNSGTYYSSAARFLQNLQQKYPFLADEYDRLIGSWRQLLTSALAWLRQNASNILNVSVQAGKEAVTVALAVIFSLYILLAKTSLKRNAGRLIRACMSDARYEKTCAFLSRCNHVFSGYIGGSLLDALIVGVVNCVVMLILRMPYPALISVIMALTNLIPTFGPIIGAVIALLIILLETPVMALWFLILTVALQALDAYLIKPLLMKGSTGLDALGVLLAIIIGGKLFGVLGMLVGIPVAAILVHFVGKWVTRVLSARDAAKAAPADKQDGDSSQPLRSEMNQQGEETKEETIL